MNRAQGSNPVVTAPPETCITRKPSTEDKVVGAGFLAAEGMTA